MQRIILFCLAVLVCSYGMGQQKMKDGFYLVPDSVKATGFITDISISKKNKAKKVAAFVLVNNTISLGLTKNKKGNQLLWNFSQQAQLKTIMQSFPFNWEYNKTYTLLIMIAGDSAKNTSICSGYIHLPNENKWKLVHTEMFTVANTVNSIFLGSSNKKKYTAQFSNRWLLRSNNSWKTLDSQTTKPPVLRPMSNIDSITQQKKEEAELNSKLPKDSVTYKDGIFYQSLQAGSGRLVNISDTVVVNYKGWLFSNGNVFDQTKEKPATFPLSRLIRGWQIGVPQCRVGGKIRLFIPSGSAYGIRTFSTNIPPNSTLVFDVEVVEVKEKK
jgi:FKBP-type peptidyl-prolyl cis-trans isomerase